MSTEKKTTKTNKKTASKGKKGKSKKNAKKKKFWLTVLFIAVILLVACVTIAREDGLLEQYGIYPKESYITESLVTQAEKDAKAEETPKAAPVQNNGDGFTTAALEIPVCPATKHGNDEEDHEVHTYSGFTLCYRESYENAEWVAYVLTRDELKAVIGRTDDFRADTQISTGSSTPQDYTRSGYDRGHLAPAADMEWSVESCHESFLMSNMSPQAPKLNRGLWKSLEEQVRTWADVFGEVVVVTGPILEKPASEYSKIGANNVSVPEYFYKALLAKVDSEDGYKTTIGVGFILPNDKCEGTIWDYAVSIDEVEQRTGLDFFSMLPDDKEASVEFTTDFSDWK